MLQAAKMSREPSPTLEDGGRVEKQPDDNSIQELRTEMRQMTSVFGEMMKGLQTLAEAAQLQKVNAEAAKEAVMAKAAEEAASVKAAEETAKAAVSTSESSEPAKASTSKDRE